MDGPDRRPVELLNEDLYGEHDAIVYYRPTPGRWHAGTAVTFWTSRMTKCGTSSGWHLPLPRWAGCPI